MEQQGLDLPPHLKQLKRTGEIYYMVVCQDTGHQTARAVTAQRTSKEVSPVTAPGHSLESFQEAMPGGMGGTGGPGGSLLVGETVLEVQKSQDDEGSEGRIPKWRDPQREETAGMCRECLQLFG